MELIGNGTFSNVYRVSEDTVRVHSVCPMKEAMSHKVFPESPFYLPVEEVSKNIYEMPYIKTGRNVLLKNPQALRLFADLNQAQNDRTGWNERVYDRESYQWNMQTLKRLKHKHLAAVLRRTLNLLNDSGYANVGFEICHENLGVDTNGHLILLDCFYSIPLLKEVREEREIDRFTHIDHLKYKETT